MGIKTPLNTIFIALQNKREKNQNGLSKQSANTTPLFVKGTQWAQRIQEFKKTNKNATKREKPKRHFYYYYRNSKCAKAIS